MKMSKRIWLHGLLLCMIMVLFSGQVQAAYVSRSITLKQNKEVTQKADEKKGKDSYTYYYKLSLPADGFITLSVRKGNKKGSHLNFKLYRRMSEDSSFCSEPYTIRDKGKAAIQIPIDKGTVYLKTSAGNKVKWKFTKVAPASNYSPQTAMNLKKGKKVTVCQTPQCSFNRWFKVILTKTQKLSFWAEAGEVVKVYDAENFLEYPVKQAGSKSRKYSTEEALKAGTYYLCMRETDSDYWSDYTERFYCSSFYWK